MYAVIVALVVLVLLFGAWYVWYFRLLGDGGTRGPMKVAGPAATKLLNRCGVTDRCLNDDVYLQRLLMAEVFGGSKGHQETYDQVLQNNASLVESLLPVVGRAMSQKLHELWDQKSAASRDLYLKLAKHRETAKSGKSAERKDDDAVADWHAKCLSIDRAAAEILARADLLESAAGRLSAERLVNLTSQYNEELVSQARNFAAGKFAESIKHLEGARNVRRAIAKQIVSHIFTRLLADGGKRGDSL